MRVIIRTVGLILLFGFQSVCLGTGADKGGLDIASSVERLIASAQKQAQAEVEEALAEAKHEMARAQMETENKQKQLEAARGLIESELKQREKARQPLLVTPPALTSFIKDKFGPERAENVLVIPSGDMDPQKLAETLEDMKIMSHIFTKELDEADMTPDRRSWILFWRRNGTEPSCIYLEEYGAVFLLEVDFPLLPVVRPAEKQIEEGTDPVWEQARRELTASEDDILDYDSDEEVEYDADRVRNLKSKLIRNLKHASNIRNLPDDESIVIAVTGSGNETVGVQMMRPVIPGMGGGGHMGGAGGMMGTRMGRAKALASRGGRNTKTGRVSIKAPGAEIEVSGTTGIDQDAPTTLTSGNVLIMRAKKADVDAFARGKLDFDKFQKRIQIFTY